MNKANKEKIDLQYYIQLPYTIKLIPEEKGYYFAEIEEYDGCMAQGETIKEMPSLN